MMSSAGKSGAKEEGLDDGDDVLVFEVAAKLADEGVAIDDGLREDLRHGRRQREHVHQRLPALQTASQRIARRDSVDSTKL